MIPNATVVKITILLFKLGVLIYFIFYFKDDFIKCSFMILFIIFNLYSYLFTFLKDPGCVKSRLYGDYNIEEIELMDGKLIKLDIENDQRVVIYKDKVDLRNKENFYIGPRNKIETDVVECYKMNRITKNSITEDFNEDLTEDTITFYQKYCSFCNNFKSPGVSHCFDCENCIIDKDHHCPMLNTCIGRNNIKSYMYFLLSDLILNMYFTVLTNIDAHGIVYSTKLGLLGVITCIILTKCLIIIPIINLIMVIKFYYFALIDIKARDWYLSRRTGSFSIKSVIKRLLTFRSEI